MKHATYAARMEEKIRETLNPVSFEIIDDSHRHHGHAGANPSGETHFTLRITSAAFNGLSRIERQRKVYTLLSSEMEERVHALVLQLKGIGED